MEKIPAAVFNEVEGVLEPLRAVVVRIRHTVGVRMHREIVRHFDHFPLINGSRRQSLQPIEIGIIHSYDNIEVIEIRRPDLTASMSKIESTHTSMCPHPGIRKVAGMSAVKSGRINLKEVRDTTLRHESLHDALGSRASAYIAETYKKYPIFHLAH